MTQQRMPWPQYFMGITKLVAERSTCSRRKVGAIAVKDKRILATGYNGAPSGMADCLEIGCLREKMGIPSGERHELCRGLHAEQNVIIQAAVHGIPLVGAEIYCTHQPCLICSKMLINCGIVAVHYESPYPDEMAEALLRESGVRFDLLKTESITLDSDCCQHGLPVKPTHSVKSAQHTNPDRSSGVSASDKSGESGMSGNSENSCISKP